MEVTSPLPLLALSLAAALRVLGHQPQDLPWTILSPSRDARTREMVAFDEQMDEHLVATLNGSETFRGRLQLTRGRVSALAGSRSAFVSLHFDPTKPAALTPEEGKALEQYLARGGFILLIEDNYCYLPADYRRPIEGTLFDFFTRALPQRNPDFRSERVKEDHPIFRQVYRIEIPWAIQRESLQNPFYRGETVFFYKDRLAGYTYSLYGFDDGESFAPIEPPYRPYRLMEAGYQVVVNIYHYALVH